MQLEHSNSIMQLTREDRTMSEIILSVLTINRGLILAKSFGAPLGKLVIGLMPLIIKKFHDNFLKDSF